jgi:hypothetical protein
MYDLNVIRDRENERQRGVDVNLCLSLSSSLRLSVVHEVAAGQ